MYYDLVLLRPRTHNQGWILSGGDFSEGRPPGQGPDVHE